MNYWATMNYTVERYHDISCGHRVHGHEGKCALLHGHNYRIFFTCTADTLDGIGRVIDFSVIKARLCQWLEAEWDHRFLAWVDDPLLMGMHDTLPPGPARDTFDASVVWVPFNPTAENMAEHLLRVVGPTALVHTGAKLVAVRVEETRKCSAQVAL